MRDLVLRQAAIPGDELAGALRVLDRLAALKFTEDADAGMP